MEIIDITIGIKNGMLVWPGDEAAKIGWESKIADGAMSNVSSIQIGAHVETHIDMPLHFIEGGKTMDDLDLSKMIGKAIVVEVPSGSQIDADFLESLNLDDVNRILFKTSNSSFWDDSPTDFVEEYTGLEPSAAEWLVAHACQLVGIDYLSIAPYDDSETTHKILLSNDVVILETLDLRKIEPGEAELICLPLKLECREAAPCRAVLIKG